MEESVDYEMARIDDTGREDDDLLEYAENKAWVGKLTEGSSCTGHRSVAEVLIYVPH